MPYAYDMQKAIFVKAVLTLQKEDVEYITTTTAQINANTDVVNITNKLQNYVLNKAKNTEQPNLEISNDITLSINFDRVSNFDLKIEETEENTTE